MFILLRCNSWKYELGQLVTTYISSSDRNQTAFNKASGMMETREIGGVARQWEHWVKSWEKKALFWIRYLWEVWKENGGNISV